MTQTFSLFFILSCWRRFRGLPGDLYRGRVSEHMERVSGFFRWTFFLNERFLIDFLGCIWAGTVGYYNPNLRSLTPTPSPKNALYPSFTYYLVPSASLWVFPTIGGLFLGVPMRRCLVFGFPLFWETTMWVAWGSVVIKILNEF